MKKFIVFLLIACSLITIAEAANPITAFGDNIRSGALFDSLGNFGKNSVFSWCTTVAGEYNPSYDGQRKFMDFVISLILFLVIVKYSLKKMWPDMEKTSMNLLIAAVGTALAIAFVASTASFCFLVKYINNLSVFGLGIALGFLLDHFFNKDKKITTKLGFIVLGIVISLLIINAISFTQGKGLSVGFGSFNTEKRDDLKARVITSGAGITSTDPKVNYDYALAAVQQYQYDKAKEYFEKVIAFGPANNPYYKKTAKWITQEEGDLLFRHMAEHYPGIMDAERAAANILLDKAEKLQQEGGDKAQIKALVDKARAYTIAVIEKEATLKREMEKRRK